MTAGRVGYSAEVVELWRVDGDSPEEEALGEWPDVYDIELDGGVTAGVPFECVEETAVSGDATCAAEYPLLFMALD